MRVCRYEVLGVVEEELCTPLRVEEKEPAKYLCDDNCCDHDCEENELLSCESCGCDFEEGESLSKHLCEDCFRCFECDTVLYDDNFSGNFDEQLCDDCSALEEEEEEEEEYPWNDELEEEEE